MAVDLAEPVISKIRDERRPPGRQGSGVLASRRRGRCRLRHPSRRQRRRLGGLPDMGIAERVVAALQDEDRGGGGLARQLLDVLLAVRRLRRDVVTLDALPRAAEQWQELLVQRVFAPIQAGYDFNALENLLCSLSICPIYNIR